MDEIIIKNEKYLSAKKAGYILGYASDYVSRLCRESKIKSQIIGKKWYILESDISAYSERVENEKNIKQKELSKIRIREYQKSLKKEGMPAAALVMVCLVAFFGFQLYGSSSLSLKYTQKVLTYINDFSTPHVSFVGFNYLKAVKVSGKKLDNSVDLLAYSVKSATQQISKDVPSLPKGIKKATLNTSKEFSVKVDKTINMQANILGSVSKIVSNVAVAVYRAFPLPF